MTTVQKNDSKNGQITVPEEVRQKILTYFSIERAPKEKQDEVLVRFGEVVFQQIVSAVLDRLDEQGKMEYKALFDRQASPDEVEAFSKIFVPEYETIVSRVIHDLMEKLHSVDV